MLMIVAAPVVVVWLIKLWSVPNWPLDFYPNKMIIYNILIPGYNIAI